MADDDEEVGGKRLGELFERLRRARVETFESGSRYSADDVIAVLALLDRGYNPAEIERNTLIQRGTITRWRDAFLTGQIEAKFPDIRERMANFNLDWLPSERQRRVRPKMAWQQNTMRLEDRPNPYHTNGSGKANGSD